MALDPRNGEILALVSSPAYDPNLFARRLAGGRLAGALEDPNHPLQNRASRTPTRRARCSRSSMAGGRPRRSASSTATRRLLQRRDGLLQAAVPLLEARRPRLGEPRIGAQELVRRLLLPPRPEARHRAHRPLRRDSSASARRPASTSTARSSGLVPDHGLEPAAAQAPLVPGRDDLGVDRPGPAAGDAAADGGRDRGDRQRRPARHAAPGARADEPAPAPRRDRLPARPRADPARPVGGGQRPGHRRLGPGRRASRSPARPAPCRSSRTAAHEDRALGPASSATTPGSPRSRRSRDPRSSSSCSSSTAGRARAPPRRSPRRSMRSSSRPAIVQRSAAAS